MQTAAPNPDHFLARRAAAGQTEAWDEIIELYGGRIYNLALQFAFDKSEAEDLTQDIFLKLYRNLHQYHGEVPLVAWTLRLSRNLCIDRYRQSRRRPLTTTIDDARPEFLASSDNPQQTFQRAQRLEIVRATLREMSEDLAEALILRDLQGLSYEEVAATLGIPMGTVKTRIFRARKELARRVADRITPPTVSPLAASLEAAPC